MNHHRKIDSRKGLPKCQLKKDERMALHVATNYDQVRYVRPSVTGACDESNGLFCARPVRGAVRHPTRSVRGTPHS